MHRILLLTPELPYPPEQGASLRNLYILQGLARCYDVSLLSASSSEGVREGLDESPLHEVCPDVRVVYVPLRSRTRRMSKLFSERTPDIANRFQNALYENALSEFLLNGGHGDEVPGRFDAVQIEGLELAHAIRIIRKHSPTTRILFDAHNAETELQRRALHTDLSSMRRWPAAAYSYIQTHRLNRYEAWACQSADWVTSVSESDAKYLSRYIPTQSLSVIPNCIDVEEYNESKNSGVETFDLLFTGKMDYRPNIDAVLWFAREIWPIILEKRPETTWAIVGKNPHSRLERLRSSPGVTVTGYVDRVQPYLAGAKVVVLPLRMGSGTRLKLLEALASSKAVVSTAQGAEGFPGIGAEAIEIEDEPEQFASSVLSLLDHQDKRDQLGTTGRRYAEDYDWRRIIPLFEDVYKTLLRAS
ncbi:MAG: glycosyltransferase [Candidatus Promineifilaceae bacterium]